ncbi:hypothetical protein ACEQPO_08400 [Bacillus sp. SL00103]
MEKGGITMKLHLVNSIHFAEELEEIERKAKIAWENIWLEVADQLRSESIETIVIHKGNCDGRKECVLKSYF